VPLQGDILANGVRQIGAEAYGLVGFYAMLHYHPNWLRTASLVRKQCGAFGMFSRSLSKRVPEHKRHLPELGKKISLRLGARSLNSVPRTHLRAQPQTRGNQQKVSDLTLLKRNIIASYTGQIYVTLIGIALVPRYVEIL
jgi:hypothetical protein